MWADVRLELPAKMLEEKCESAEGVAYTLVPPAPTRSRITLLCANFEADLYDAYRLAALFRRLRAQARPPCFG